MITTENLGRYFGSIKAVDGITFSVNKGEVLGFLGPNGAGKSTTMKMLTCFLTPSFGTASIAGFSILEDSRAVRAKIGYLPENAPLYGDMAVRDFLRFVAEVRGFNGRSLNEAVARVIEITGLVGVTEQRIETLSKGFRRRVGLAQALIHDPEILILDEPTDGLDPNQKHEVRNLIRSMAKDKCIILSTHILEEVDEVCTRAIIIANGKIVADESPDVLRHRSSSYGAVSVCFSDPIPERASELLKTIVGVKKVTTTVHGDGVKEFTVFPEKGMEGRLLVSVVQDSQAKGYSLSRVVSRGGELDEVFREITQGAQSQQ